MPKAAKDALIWLPEERRYTLRRDGESLRTLPTDDETAWYAWLATVASFSFQGQQGRANLLKERRKGSDGGYWYAYQRQGKQVRKRYVGRDAELSLHQLEAVVSSLTKLTAENREAAASVPKEAITLGNKATMVDEITAPQPRSPGPLSPLLRSKVQPPRLHADLIARPRLLHQLDSAYARRLTLVTAPAGFGKTTLVRQWLATRDGQAAAVAWLALDSSDNDPVRFWRYLIAAYQTIEPTWGEAALLALTTMTQLPFEPVPLETIVTALLNALSLAAQPTLLLLDDYHLITAPIIHNTVEFFLEHLPTSMHLLLLTRREPPLPLARWRMRNELLELGTADLRFSQQEVAAFQQQILTLPTLALSEQHAGRIAVERLSAQLEGWPAGWRLLALALAGVPTLTAVERFLTTFAGSQRPLLTYFVDEVLHTLSPPLQHFLLQISVLGRFTRALCEAVTANAHSGQLLDELVQAGLFLERLEGESGWYRLHPLFAEAMHHEARRQLGSEQLCAVADKASLWYEQQDLLSEAVEAALRAPNFDRAAELIKRLSNDQRFSGQLHHSGMPSEFYTVQRWLTQFPPTLLHQHPDLCLEYATALLMIHFAEHHPAEVMVQLNATLGAAERGFRALGNTAKLAEVFAFRALLTRQQGEFQQALTWAQQALAWLPPDELAWRSVSYGIVGLGELLTGQLDVAYHHMQTARELIQVIGNPHFLRATLGQLSLFSVEAGDLHQTVAYLRPMLAEARSVGDADDIGHAQLGLAQVAYEWNELTEAHAALLEAQAAIRRSEDEALLALATLLLIRIAYAQGADASSEEGETAQQQLIALLMQVQPHLSARHLYVHREIRLVQARCQLRAGDLAAVERWWVKRRAETAPQPPLYATREELVMARWLLARSETDQAIDHLTELLTAAQSAQRIQQTLEIRVLLALAYAARQQRENAIDQLQTVVTFTALQGHLRLFLDEGPLLLPLLRALYPTLTDQTQRAHVRQIVQAFTKMDPTTVAEPALDLIEALSPQEERVLHALATGSSNAAIAQELIVSVNTIRSQLQSIYRKLDVNSRVAAVETARRIGLLDK